MVPSYKSTRVHCVTVSLLAIGVVPGITSVTYTADIQPRVGEVRHARSQRTHIHMHTFD